MKLCLIVDDSKIVRKICADIVKELGYEVAEAENGQEALDFCQGNMPELILLDCNMPVMDCIEFLKHFRLLQIVASFYLGRLICLFFCYQHLHFH